MASYAPLFAQAEGWQWTPDMIWVDNLHVYGTPNYYVQQLYSLHKGTDLVSILADKQVIAGQDGVYASAVTDSKTKELIVKVINTSDKPVSRNVVVEGGKKMAAKGTLTVMQNSNLDAVNSFSNAVNLSPKQGELKIKGNAVTLLMQPYSFNIVRVQVR